MSTEYDANYVVGWLLDEDNIPKKYRSFRKEVSHLEDRFDPKTGKKITQEKVIDSEEQDIFVLEGEEYDDSSEFFEHLAITIGGVTEQVGDFNGGDVSYAIEPAIDKADMNEGDLKVLSMPKYTKKLKVMQRKLAKLGFDVGEPMIRAVLNVS
jgi:hypothetical protein